MLEYSKDGYTWFPHLKEIVGRRPYKLVRLRNNSGEVYVRSIYLGKPKVECPSCGGPKLSKPVGWTVGNEPVYGCKDEWHIRSIPATVDGKTTENL